MIRSPRRRRWSVATAGAILAVAFGILVPSPGSPPGPVAVHPALGIVPEVVALRENFTPGWTNVSVGLGEDQVPAARTLSAGAYYPSFTAWVVYGGRDASGRTLSDTLLFVTGEGEWDALTEFWNGSQPPSPPGLSAASLTYDAADGYLLMFGGQTSDGSDYGGTWRFSGVTWNDLQWTQVPSNGAPSPPASASDRLVYDSADGYVLLYTGTGSSPTWSYRAGVWNPVAAGQEPASRQQPALVDDPDLGGVVLFGGGPAIGAVAAAHPLNDTWVYRDGNWSPLQWPVAPPPMSAPIGVFDVSDGYLLLIGGTVGGVSVGRESTWALTSLGWSNLSGAGDPSPPARFGAVMFSDPLDGTVLLYGGTLVSTGAALGDMWAWNLPATRPDSRIAAFPLAPPVLVLVGIGGIVPPALAWAYFRRPPRRQPTDVPHPTPSPA